MGLAPSRRRVGRRRNEVASQESGSRLPSPDGGRPLCGRASTPTADPRRPDPAGPGPAGPGRTGPDPAGPGPAGPGRTGPDPAGPGCPAGPGLLALTLLALVLLALAVLVLTLLALVLLALAGVLVLTLLARGPAGLAGPGRSCPASWAPPWPCRPWPVPAGHRRLLLGSLLAFLNLLRMLLPGIRSASFFRLSNSLIVASVPVAVADGRLSRCRRSPTVRRPTRVWPPDTPLPRLSLSAHLFEILSSSRRVFW